MFLISQHDKRGGTFWGLPKGHPEVDETGEETARRELFEEAGIVAVRLESKYPFEQRYSFMWEDSLVKKTVTYYIAHVADKNYRIQPDEVAEAGWFSLEKANKLLTHKNNKKLLVEVKKFLKHKK